MLQRHGCVAQDDGLVGLDAWTHMMGVLAVECVDVGMCRFRRSHHVGKRLLGIVQVCYGHLLVSG